MVALAELLARFSEAHGTSGYEDAVRALVVREFKKLVDQVEITPLGSVIGFKRASAGGGRLPQPIPRVLVEAHMDEIGLIVTAIQEGFIRFDEVGTFDPRVLPSQNVLVHGVRPLPGVIGSRPPHVLSAHERSESLPLRDLFVDVGLAPVQVHALVRPGDFITLDRKVMLLQNGHYAGKAFDDRASLVALVEMLRQLQGFSTAWDIYAVANVNEEESPNYVGALTSTFRLEPQLAIALDVTHAQQPGTSGDEMPRLGQGPSIARGANVHPLVFEKLRQAAVRENIPHQISVYGDDTETNAWMMQVTGAGVPSGLVEIPLRYMHTSVETIQLDDVARTAELLRVLVAGLTLEDAMALRGETFTRAQTRRATTAERRMPARRGAKRPAAPPPKAKRQAPRARSNRKR
jgi:endoglucanase